MFKDTGTDVWFLSSGFLHCKTDLKDEDGEACNCIYFDGAGILCSDLLFSTEEVTPVDVEIRWTRRKEA